MKTEIIHFVLLCMIPWLSAMSKTKECTLDLRWYQIQIDIPENAKVQYNSYEEGTFISIYDSIFYKNRDAEGLQRIPPIIVLFSGGLTKLPLIDTAVVSECHITDTPQQHITYGIINGLYFKEIEDKETHVRMYYQYVPKKKLKMYNRILRKARIIQ